MIHTIGLAATHMECRNLQESLKSSLSCWHSKNYRRSPARRHSNIQIRIGSW